MKKILLFELLFYFLITPPLYSQNFNLNFQHLTTEDGLSQNSVYCITQDSLGFMWVGTQNGLNRYDGQHFKIFKHEDSVNSLTSGAIRCLYSDHHNHLWIGTDGGGLDMLDLVSEKFTHYIHDSLNPNSVSSNKLLCLMGDHEGKIWIGTNGGGLNIFDPSTKQFKCYVLDPKNAHARANYVKCFCKDKNKTVWIGTLGGGLYSFDLLNKNFTYHPYKATDPNGAHHGWVQALFEDDSGVLWTGGLGGGLDSYNKETGIFTCYSKSFEDSTSQNENLINCIFQDDKKLFWLGSLGAGLSLFNEKTGKVHWYNSNENDNYSISDNYITCIFTNHSKSQLWIGTYNAGINIVNLNCENFFTFNYSSTDKYSLPDESIVCFGQDKKKNILIGTEEGSLISLNKYTGSFINYTKDPAVASVLQGLQINSIQEIRDDDLMVATRGKGLIFFDPLSKKIKSYLPAPFDLTLSEDNDIANAYEDNQGTIWISIGLKGIKTFDYITGKFSRYHNDSSSLKIFNNSDVSHFYENAEGLLCFDDQSGVYTYNWETDELINLFPQHTEQFSHQLLFLSGHSEDSHRILWIGGYTKGLIGLPKEGKKNFLISKEDGLPGDYVHDVIADKNGNLWVETNAGLCRIITDSLYASYQENAYTSFPSNKNFIQVFNIKNGCPGNEITGASLMDSDGWIYFVYEKGLMMFDPNSFPISFHPSPIILSDFKIFGKDYASDTSISYKRQIDLNYQQNFVSFNFASLDYISPERYQYAYKLDGLDKNWNFCGNRTFANYTNLNPGNYTLHVIGTNHDGVWNIDGATEHIFIFPPFWRTWWFYTLCLILFCGMLYGIYYYRLQQILKLQHVRNKIASDLHDDIGSTLSSIVIYSELANEEVKDKSKKASSLLETINENSRTTIEAMSDIVWAINPKNDRFENILQRMRTFASGILEAKNIDLKFDASPSLPGLKLSMEKRKNLYLVFKEAVNNIAKYSSSKTCTIKLWLEGKILNIKIEDDGIGFDLNDYAAGNGLVSMKRRSEEMKGDLNIQSIKGKGTTIHLSCSAT
ncbi:MAG: hypothetical protein H0W62_04270 [Chitinophagales bacterium]|nr:hypothetical protein [Chitinophagales bacterium]